jgi:hypothetical protein
MGWTNAFEYLKQTGAKHGIGSADQRADEDLPLHARIGSLVTLQIAPFLRAQSAGSLIAVPQELQATIRAIGHLKLDFDGDVYRYYLATGDDDMERECFLQVVTDRDGKVQEFLYGARLARFIPESAEDQELFTGAAGAGLGQKCYALYREQLAEAGCSEDMIEAALRGGEQVSYLREPGHPDDDFLPPFKGEEVRIDDAIGEHGLEQQVWFMPYARELDGLREYLLITTQLVKSRDGDAGKRAMYVDLVVGIPLEAERVVVQ